MFSPRCVPGWLVVSMIVWFSNPESGSGQEPAAPPRSSHLQPVPSRVCPPRFSVPMFVEAEVLLQQAEKDRPRTPQGWIVRDVPVADCVNDFGDAAERSYQWFDFPLQLRQYDTKIRLLQAEVGALQRKLATYEYFNKTGVLLVTVESTRLALQSAQEQLRNQRYERTLFIRLHQLERQLSQGSPATAGT